MQIQPLCGGLKNTIMKEYIPLYQLGILDTNCVSAITTHWASYPMENLSL